MNSWCNNLELLIKSRTTLIWIKTKEEERLEKYKLLLKFRNIPFDADLFTWNSD